MNKGKTAKTIAVLAALAIVLTISVTSLNVKPTPIPTLDSTSVQVLPAQVVWERTYGGAGDDRAFYALPAGDDNILVVGSTKSAGHQNVAGWVLMLNQEGDLVWNKAYFEGLGTELRFALNVDGNFLLVGNVFLPKGNIDGYVAKINSQGEVVWSTVVGGLGVDKLFSAVAADDGFVLVGLTHSTGSSDSDAWTVKIDLGGNIVWDKSFGGSANEALRSSVLSEDGNYVAAGYTDAQETDNFDFLLLKIDGAGGLVWNRTYGGVESQKAHSTAKAEDGYILVGEAQSLNRSSGARVVKVDFDGELVWSKTVGGKDADSALYISQSQSGGYLVAGFTFSFGSGERDFWVFKIDDDGAVLWSYTLGTEAFEEAYCIVETGQTGVVLVGWADPWGKPELIGKATYDFYIAKINVNQAK